MEMSVCVHTCVCWPLTAIMMTQPFTLLCYINGDKVVRSLS